MKTPHCPSFPSCGGCDFLGAPLSNQLIQKQNELSALLLARGISFPSIETLSPASHGLRDRLDFTLENGRLGLMHKFERRIVDLPDCLQLSPALREWLSDFRKNLPPVRRGSVRLRVGPRGTRGMWLDFANLDIKAVLDEAGWIRSWEDSVRIEMGQRRKRLRRDEGSRPHLVDPELFPWFQSSWRDQIVPLYGLIGGFTQPSLKANQWITDWVQESVLRLKPTKIVEFGAGQGNLSFPALSGEARLTACENDRMALEGFAMSLDALSRRGYDLKNRVSVESGDFLRKSSPALREADLLIANPPRSGLKAFLDPLPEARNLKYILYMSCHPTSFAEDAPRLAKEGFALEKLRILDQFPQTKHYEVLSEWSRVEHVGRRGE